MMMLPALALLSAAAAPAALPAHRLIVTGVVPGNGGMADVEVTFLNTGSLPGSFAFPDSLSAVLTVRDRRTPVMLDRADTAGSAAPVGAHGFAQGRYRMRLPVPLTPGTAVALSIPGDTAPGQAFVAPAATLAEQASEPASGPAPAAISGAALDLGPSAKPDRGNAFLANLTSYTPIYAVYGPGTNTDARIQIGFKYQLFGQGGAVGGANPLLNGIHFGYTQRLFWDLGRKSSPFRNVEYMPELFYLLPAAPVGRGIALGGQAGIRHESNGRDGLASRSVNTVYIQPVATTMLGNYTVSLGPRLWFYAGSLDDNPDIRRYRGNSGLFAEIGEPDGWRLTTSSRINFGTGRGAIDAALSYPLDRIVDTNLNLYVFGQGFAGYGENLLDYDRHVTRLRIGVGFVR